MAEYSYEDYLKNRETKSSNNNSFKRSNVGYFKLSDDGDEAIVRFAYSSVKEFNLAHVHSVQIDDKWRKVLCLRNVGEPVSKCPLCAKGEKVFSKFYVKLIEYVMDENGNVKPQPKVWERPESFANTLAECLNEYGDLKDCIFKIKRTGKKGDKDTKYTVMYVNPMKYKESDGFVKDFSDFDTLDLAHHSYVRKTYEELAGVEAEDKEIDDTVLVNEDKPVSIPTPTPKTVEVEDVPNRPRRTWDYN